VKGWWPLLFILLIPGCILATLELLRRRHARENAPDYVERIQSLQPDTPAALPPIRPLKAVRTVPKRRRRAPKAEQIAVFAQRKSR
jgi:hypothetical protein